MGRVDRRRKKKKMSIWLKILIIIALFIIAGFSGYFIGDISGNQNAKGRQEQLKQEQEKQKKKINHYQLNEEIPIDDNISVKVKQCMTYPKVKGPKFPIGLEIEVINQTNKKQELPFKYLFKLQLKNQGLAQSVGIYSQKDLNNDGELVAETMKLQKKEKRTVVYLFSAKNKEAYQGDKAELTINSEKGQQKIKMTIKKQKGTNQESSSTTSSTVIQEASTSTTYEQTTQMEVTTSSAPMSSAVQQTNQNQMQQTEQPTQMTQEQTVVSQGQLPTINAGQMAASQNVVQNQGAVNQGAMNQGGMVQ